MTTTTPTTSTTTVSAISACASTAVDEVLNQCHRKDNVAEDDHDIPCSTMIFTVGGSATGKTQTVFGVSIANIVSSSTRAELLLDDNAMEGYGHNNSCGLLGEIVNGILLSSQLCCPDSIFKCSISILEIVNADVLRDILAISDKKGRSCDNSGSKTLRIRHVDARGAAVLNLHQVTIDTTEQLSTILHSTFKSKVLRRAWNNEGGHGHFIVTIGVYRPGGYCAKIQLVDLSSPDRHDANATTLGDVRKSLSALRGVLRGLVLQQHTNHMNSHVPYRESTLTRLLQRSFDASTHSVVIGTVNTSSNRLRSSCCLFLIWLSRTLSD